MIYEQKIQYNSMAFIIIKPPSRIISTHFIKNRDEHIDLLRKAKDKKCLVYYANIDDSYNVIQPWLLDRESIDNFKIIHDHGFENQVEPESESEPEPEPEPESKVDLRCHICGKLCHSTSGLTLHIKSKHK